MKINYTDLENVIEKLNVLVKTADERKETEITVSFDLALQMNKKLINVMKCMNDIEFNGLKCASKLVDFIKTVGNDESGEITFNTISPVINFLIEKIE